MYGPYLIRNSHISSPSGVRMFGWIICYALNWHQDVGKGNLSVDEHCRVIQICLCDVPDGNGCYKITSGEDIFDEIPDLFGKICLKLFTLFDMGSNSLSLKPVPQLPKPKLYALEESPVT